MAIVELDIRPDRRKLRQFGVVSLVAFSLIGGFVLWRGGLFGADFGAAKTTVALALFALGALAGVFALVYPPANRILYVALVLVTFPIGFVVSYVLMGSLFYVMLTPLALVFRLIGRDPLCRRYDRAAKTYWVDREDASHRANRYFKQF